MEEALLSQLAGDTGLLFLLGDRIQWAVREDAPSLTLHLIDAPPDYHLKGASGLVQARVQMDCAGRTYLEAKAIGDAAVAALPAIRQVLGGIRFQGCTVIDTERDRLGDAPNIFHRTRIDVRVSFSPA